MDEKQSPVEDFKISGFEKKLQAKLRRVNAVEKVLRAVGMREQAKMQNIMQLYQQTMDAKSRLMAVDPKVNELPGMEFEEEGGEEGAEAQIQGQAQGPQLPLGAQPMINY
jgi:hypothetical protein